MARLTLGGGVSVASSDQTRGNTEARADELIQFGRELFESQELFAPETKLRKMVRAGLRKSGYERTKAEIVGLFNARVGHDIETYEKALKTSSIKNIARVGKKKALVAGGNQLEGEDQNRISTKRN
ncbi:hypothetical protein [Microbacterium sp. NPDC089696]|uniref:hypothetical protein n=1 Tax=Microbacterium sp. NPDC089696 TaxID=3364199 RepID=UPI00382EAA33